MKANCPWCGTDAAITAMNVDVTCNRCGRLFRRVPFESTPKEPQILLKQLAMLSKDAHEMREAFKKIIGFEKEFTSNGETDWDVIGQESIAVTHWILHERLTTG